MHEIKINPDKKLYYKVKEAATEKDKNLSEYFRDPLMKQSGVELTIEFADIYRYVEQIKQLTRKVDSILPIIYRSGKIYEQKAYLGFPK